MTAVSFGEVTRISDADGDGVADRYDTLTNNWGYAEGHEFAFGSKHDAEGNIWVALGLSGSYESHNLFRGWAVKVTPQGTDEKDAVVGRFSLDKQFHGDLSGTSKGVMLAMSTAVSGSAGYVAMEQVNGTLNGRSGTFALQHTGTMTRGAPQLSVTVVPDSGTGDLAGLSGKMDIKITDGKHFYEFDYSIAPAP